MDKYWFENLFSILGVVYRGMELLGYMLNHSMFNPWRNPQTVFGECTAVDGAFDSLHPCQHLLLLFFLILTIPVGMSQPLYFNLHLFNV